MMTPLIPVALLFGKARTRVKDPSLTLRVGGRSKRIGAAKLLGVLVFAGFGVLFIALALTGNSDTAPGFQNALGAWMRDVAAAVDGVPNAVSLPILAVVAASFAYGVLKGGGTSSER
jgi:hypothetical protein